MDTLRLPGPTLSLRDWRLEDLGALRHWLLPGHPWQDLDAPYYAKPSGAELEALLERKRARILAGDLPTPRASLVIADAEDALMGSVNWSWESEETHWPSAGIVLYDQADWGKGYGTEALGLWTGYLFESLPQIVRLDLRTWSGNAGMMRLAEKLGYALEARFRKARIVKGAHYDGLAYGVLREEWAARYPEGFEAF